MSDTRKEQNNLEKIPDKNQGVNTMDEFIMEEKWEDLTLEEAFEQIEERISLLEDEDITLEDSFRTYQEGMKLLRYCDAKIDKVEKQVMMINEDGGLDEF